MSGDELTTTIDQTVRYWRHEPSGAVTYRNPEVYSFNTDYERVHVLTEAELAAHTKAARADERERIAAAIEAESAYRNGRDRAQWGDLERIVDITFATAARIARTPDPNGDNT